jgi:two-component system nitrate/nitrite response regulator NarL
LFWQESSGLKLLVVDDHPMLRNGLAALLTQAEPGTTVLQAPNATNGLEIASSRADLDGVMLDLSMPGMDGFAALVAFRQLCPALPVIVVSSSEESGHVRRAIELGARGYIPKSASPQTVLTALRLVLSGELYLPPMMLAERADASAAPRLTERQVAVLTRLSDGQSNKTIAAELDISEKTVKAHVGAIFRALNAVNRTQAVSQARRMKLLP